jgi:DNA-binding transcriptional LysR family regulator
MATFVRVVEAGSLLAAAKRLRISAAAVSRQLTMLEREVGAALLARHPELRFDVRVEDRVIDLVLEDVDIAARVGAEPPSSTRRRAPAPFLRADELERRRLCRLLPRWQTEPIVVYALYCAAHRNERRVWLLVEHLREAYAFVAEAPRLSQTLSTSTR